MGHQVERPELVHAKDDFGFVFLGYDFAVCDRVEVLDARLLGRVVGVPGGLPGLQALKGDAFLAEQDAQALVADVVDHPLGNQEVCQLGQAPGRERQVVLGGPGLRDLLDLAALGQRERLRPATGVLRIQRVEAVGVEVVDHIPDPARTGERHLGDLRHKHALRGQQYHLGPPPGHHRPGPPADDPQKPPPLIVIDLSDTHSFCHPNRMTPTRRRHSTRMARHITTGQRLSDAAVVTDHKNLVGEADLRPVQVVELDLERLGQLRGGPQFVRLLHVAAGLHDDVADRGEFTVGVDHGVHEPGGSADHDDRRDLEPGLGVGELLFRGEQLGVRHGFLRWV
ncbi:hypothetical protein GA0115254_108115 [Streptomyces sp. Ncost-T10-10d]|nr:hypothetical protein GA0115254_108115 [Streptomyces sp. Ncost-T10-10d]